MEDNEGSAGNDAIKLQQAFRASFMQLAGAFGRVSWARNIKTVVVGRPPDGLESEQCRAEEETTVCDQEIFLCFCELPCQEQMAIARAEGLLTELSSSFAVSSEALTRPQAWLMHNMSLDRCSHFLPTSWCVSSSCTVAMMLSTGVP